VQFSGSYSRVTKGTNVFEGDLGLVFNKELDEKSMVIFDTEFEERIDVVLKEDKIYCKRDRSSNCKHVLFALGNPEFYQRVKKNNIGLTFLTTSSRTKKM